MAIGVPEIDGQHAEIFERADRFLAALRAGRASEELGALFAWLGSYVDAHFAAEERLMERHRYAAYAVHREMHDELRADLARLGEDLAAGPGCTSAIILRVNNILSGRLVNHICTVDVKLADLGRTEAASALPGPAPR